jgi:hypothetical protein
MKRRIDAVGFEDAVVVVAGKSAAQDKSDS